MRAWSTAGVLLALLVLAPTAAAYHGQPGRAGLVIEGPVDLDGAVSATASPGAAFWTYAEGDFPFRLTAASVDVERVERTERSGTLSLAFPPTVTREHTTLQSATAALASRGAAFQLLAYQTGLSMVRAESDSARIVPHPPGGVAPTLAAQRQGLDAFGQDAFTWGLSDHGARFESATPRVSAMGDFTLFLYDATLRVRHAEGTATYRTGVYREESALATTPDAAPSRTVAYILLHVRDGQLDIGPAPGFVALYGSVVDATVNGTARLASASGTAFIGETRVATQGPTALVGVFDANLAPTTGGDRLRMDASGDVAAFAVPGTTHDYAPPLLTKVSIALVMLAFLGAFLKSGGATWLYSRIAGPDALRHEERERALAFVRDTPGASVAQVQEHLGVSWSTTSYHLMVLEREGMLASDRSGRHRRYFVVGSGVDRGAVAASAHPTAQALLAAVRATPGATQQELAAVAGITPSTASWHLKRLAAAGLVNVEKAWRERRYKAA